MWVTGCCSRTAPSSHWLRGVRDRHPELLIENCSSGAMRMDYALMSLLELQSTSDQMDPALYAPIAAAAPASLAPEQAGNWAYPQPGMPPEEIAFCLVTGLAGRLYLSGHLNRMSAAELALVREGVAAYEGLRADLAQAVPFWPLGLPTSLDDVVVLGLRAPAATYLYLWFPRPGEHADVTLQLPVGVEGSERGDGLPAVAAGVRAGLGCRRARPAAHADGVRADRAGAADRLSAAVGQTPWKHGSGRSTPVIRG